MLLAECMWHLLLHFHWLFNCLLWHVVLQAACIRMGQIGRLFPINSIAFLSWLIKVPSTQQLESGSLIKRLRDTGSLWHSTCHTWGEIGRDVQIRTNYFVVRLQRLDSRWFLKFCSSKRWKEHESLWGEGAMWLCKDKWLAVSISGNSLFS